MQGQDCINLFGIVVTSRYVLNSLSYHYVFAEDGSANGACVPELDEKVVAEKDARIRSFAIAQVCMSAMQLRVIPEHRKVFLSHMSSCSMFHRTANLMHSCWAHHVFTARQHPENEGSEPQSTLVVCATFEGPHAGQEARPSVDLTNRWMVLPGSGDGHCTALSSDRHCAGRVQLALHHPAPACRNHLPPVLRGHRPGLLPHSGKSNPVHSRLLLLFLSVVND